MRACERAVLVDAAGHGLAVGQQGLVVVGRAAELDPVAGGDRCLDLKEDLEPAGLGRLDEGADLGPLGVGEVGGRLRLVAKAS